MKTNNKGWYVIINPNSGKGKGRENWPGISAQLTKHSVLFDFEFTSGGGDASDIAKKVLGKGYRKLIVIGGDGTLNEVINGCFSQQHCRTFEITVALIPLGTGNDWARSHNIDFNPYEAIFSIVKNSVVKQDIGWIRFEKDKKEQKRYFVNTAGLGYDAHVVDKTNKQKLKGRQGAFLYFYNLLVCLIRARYYKASILVGDQKLSEEIFSICVAIGRYSGGGMVQAPLAKTDDGLFDVTVIKRIGKMDVLKSIKLLFNDQILTHPKVTSFRGKSVKVHSHPKMKFQVDGETLGKGDVEFGIEPTAINIISG